MRSFVPYALAGAVVAFAAGSVHAQAIGQQQPTGAQPGFGQQQPLGAQPGMGQPGMGQPGMGQQQAIRDRQVDRQFADTLRKGQVVEIVRERIVQPPPPPMMRQTVVALEDQFPEQGADNPSGLLAWGDMRDENHNPEWYLAPGVPISRDNVAMQLDPQEVPPLFRRGPGPRVD